MLFRDLVHKGVRINFAQTGTKTGSVLLAVPRPFRIEESDHFFRKQYGFHKNGRFFFPNGQKTRVVVRSRKIML